MRFLTRSLLCAAILSVPSYELSFAQPANKGGSPMGGAGKGMAGRAPQGGNAFSGNQRGLVPGPPGQHRGRVTDPSTARHGATHTPGIPQGQLHGRSMERPTANPGQTLQVPRGPSTQSRAQYPAPSNQSTSPSGGVAHKRDLGQMSPSNPGTPLHIPGTTGQSGAVPGATRGNIQAGPSTYQAPGGRTPSHFKPSASAQGEIGQKRNLGQMSPSRPGKPLDVDNAVSLDAPASSASSHDSMPSEVLPRVQRPPGYYGKD